MKTKKEAAAIGRAAQIVATLEKAEELTREVERLLWVAQDLMKADGVSPDAATSNAREVDDLRTVLRVAFLRPVRRVLNDWDGYLQARKS